MSYKISGVFPSNPVTVRGQATKLTSHKDKVIYANGKTAIIRDLSKPTTHATTYLGHVHPVSVAKFSPSGYYCASGDVSGTVRIWDTVGEDQTLKTECQRVITGKINDLAWDADSKRIIAVGDGRDRFGHAFNMDTGTSTGEISGHSKVINAVSIRQQRPYRAVTASDDTSIVFYQGPPYKFDKIIKAHSKFVQDVKFSPNGDLFVSVGSDFKIFLYDGKTGDTVGEITDDPHKGTIFAADWSPDSRSIFTSSGDKTVKLWDVETRKVKTTWTVGSTVDDIQVGNTWNGENKLVSLSLSGDLSVFDPRVTDKPARTFVAPQASISAVTPRKDSATFLAGTSSGRVFSYSLADNESSGLPGNGHSSIVVGLATSPNDDKVYSAAWDDKIKEISGNSFSSAEVKAAQQPKALAVTEDSTVFVAEVNIIEAFRNNQKIMEKTFNWKPTAVATQKMTVAFGTEDNKVYLFDWEGDTKTLKEIAKFENNKGSILSLAFSPDGKYLAAGDSAGKIMVYDLSNKELFTNRWTSHTTRVNSLSWTTDSLHLASGSLDTHVYIWSVQKQLRKIAISNAHSNGVNGVIWVDKNKLASAGADGIVRLWEVTFYT